MQQILLVILVALIGCTKSGGGDKDREIPLITFSTPSNNQVFTAGQSVAINAHVSDNKNISEVHIHISNNVTNQLLLDIHRSPGTASYILSESFVVQNGVQYKIQIIAKDNSANEARAAVIITVN